MKIKEKENGGFSNGGRHLAPTTITNISFES